MPEFSIAGQIEDYVHRIETLRQQAAKPQRNAYTVALGQLVGTGLIDYERYQQAMALPYLREENKE